MELSETEEVQEATEEKGRDAKVVGRGVCVWGGGDWRKSGEIGTTEGTKGFRDGWGEGEGTS